MFHFGVKKNQSVITCLFSSFTGKEGDLGHWVLRLTDVGELFSNGLTDLCLI